MRQNGEASTAGAVGAAPSRPCLEGVLASTSACLVGVLACYGVRRGGALLVDLAPGDLLSSTAEAVSAAPPRPRSERALVLSVVRLVGGGGWCLGG
jgi:hypothetical protein